MPRDVPASLPAPSEARAGTDRAAALVPVGHRVAELLKPVRTVTRYRDGEFDGVQELWEPKPLNAADVPEVRRQLALVEAAMTPGDSGAVLARVYSLLAHYRETTCRTPSRRRLPPTGSTMSAGSPRTWSPAPAGAGVADPRCGTAPCPGKSGRSAST